MLCWEVRHSSDKMLAAKNDTEEMYSDFKLYFMSEALLINSN